MYLPYDDAGEEEDKHDDDDSDQIIQHLSQNVRMFVTEILQKCSRR